MYSGILNVDKKEGISSAKVVSLVRAAFGQKKVGHTGTLDLEASGVLPIVLGKATRVSDYMMDKQKTYRVRSFFGKKTDTLDKAGKVIGESNKTFQIADLKEAIKSYRGEITQIPPMYSALKVGGKKLYDLAREGIEIERKKRRVRIYDIKILEFAFPLASLEITCSKGTYIRTLVDDLGEDLGSFAYVDRLRRIRVGEFKVENAIKSDDILSLSKDELIERLYPIDTALGNFTPICLDKSYFKQAINGMTMRIDIKAPPQARLYIDNQFIGLARGENNGDEYFLKMEKVFYDRQN
ncbi:MAG: tRNA pseudouridine(55) synthase TruB [Anaerococcus sp.]|nr:tRNA pseudouridine(55) synthase TruB [Anaerococcus sp.]